MDNFNNSLIKRLNEGKSTKIFIISDTNKDEENNNLLVEILPNESVYTKTDNKIPKDIDLMVICTGKAFNQSKLDKAKHLISLLATSSNKRISLCYSFVSYKDDPKNIVTTSIVKIFSAKGKNCYEKTILLNETVFDPYLLADMLAKIHDDLDTSEMQNTNSQKIKRIKANIKEKK